MIRTEHAARRAIHSSLFLPGRRALSCSLGSIDRHSKIFNTGQGTFRTTASKKFSILGNPNGGQLTYAALSAAATQTDLPDIISLQATFCKVAKTDSESELVARRLTAKKSKTQERVSVSYQQGGDSMVEFMFTFGDIEVNSVRRGFSYPSEMAHVPPLTHLTSPDDPKLVDYSKFLDEKMGHMLFIAKRHRFLVDTEDSSCTLFHKHVHDKASRESRLRGWGGHADEKYLELQDIAYLLDAFPPPILSQEPTSWVPTITYNVNFFSKPPPKTSLVKLDFQTRVAQSGTINCDGMCWDQDDNIIATSRQMARVWKP